MQSNPRLKRGLRCSSSCVTRDHLTFGECLRSKKLQLNPNLADNSRNKEWDKELNAYSDAVRQGVNPSGTKKDKVDMAMKLSESSGVAYDFEKPLFDVKVK